VRDRVFGVDTGACHGLALTGLLLPARRLVSVPARADHWARVRKQWQVPVLRRQPWPTMAFEQIGKKVGKLRDPELGDESLDRILGWLESLRAAIPDLRGALEAEVARLEGDAGADFGRAAAAHPAASWLLRHRAGKLSPTHLGCSTPADLVRLARALGRDLPAEPLSDVHGGPA